MAAVTPIRIRKRPPPAVNPVANSPTHNWPLGGPDLTIEHLPTDSLKPRARQTRKHSARQIAQLEASISHFGITRPLIIDKDNGIVAGVGTWLALKNLKVPRVPTVRLEHLSDDELRAYAIADNRLAELSGWDDEVLRLELGELISFDLGFEIELTGFETVEIDNMLIAGAAAGGADPDDELADEVEGRPISRLGDIFSLGDHRLICGDAREAGVYARLLGDERARMVFSDAPYNLRVDSLGGNGKIQHAEFQMASGEMSRAEFTTFLTTVFERLAAVSVDGAIHFQCMDFRHQIEMMTAGEAAYTEFKQLIIWVKDNGGQGAFYRSQHELIYVFKVGRAKHLNNFGLGEKGRYRTNVWKHAGVNTLRKGRMDDLAAHPTVKPTALVADAIRDVSKRGEIVLDPFCGSGTTIMAAERTGRLARCVELEPKYIDVAIQRWEKATGKTAIHDETGCTFAELTSSRREVSLAEEDDDVDA